MAEQSSTKGGGRLVTLAPHLAGSALTVAVMAGVGLLHQPVDVR